MLPFPGTDDIHVVRQKRSNWKKSSSIVVGWSRVDEVGSVALLEVHEHEDEHRRDEEVEGGWRPGCCTLKVQICLDAADWRRLKF